MPRNLLDELNKRPLLCDGGMGTQLIAAGMQLGESAEAWNVNRTDAVRGIHERYRAAGCELITSNTFGGTAAALARHGLGEQVRALNEAGAKLAAEAAGEGAFVLGDIGPFGGFLEPLGETRPDELRAMFKEQAQALLAGGADVIVVETMSDPNEMACGIQAAKEAGAERDGVTVIATYAFERAQDGTFRTMMGVTVEAALKAAIEAGADVVGSNCGTSLDLDDYVDLARELVAAAGDVPVIIQPNAGSPIREGENIRYPATPEDMAKVVPRLLEIGVRIVGGCCGTTPDHLREMKKALESSGA